MATKTKDQNELQQEKINQTVSKTEQLYNENKAAFWGVIIGVIALGLIILAYQQFITKPKMAEAQEQMYPAEAAFRAGNFEAALNGDGNTLGFAEVINEYGSKAGKAAYLYAGICELQTKNYSEAVNYLKKYTGKDEILSARAASCMGDAYVGLGDYKAALAQFEKAAGIADNAFTAGYLLKAAVVCEELGQKDKALSIYKQIKDKYPQSIEGYDVDKYIGRIEAAE
ncbi:MAG: tetratricopeptide repeat protein [Bacteroidales bacterium]|nr:tetratricopeptide repeat protein [Candidatus Cryptobacteroides onthequi]